MQSVKCKGLCCQIQDLKCKGLCCKIQDLAVSAGSPAPWLTEASLAGSLGAVPLLTYVTRQLQGGLDLCCWLRGAQPVFTVAGRTHAADTALHHQAVLHNQAGASAYQSRAEPCPYGSRATVKAGIHSLYAHQFSSRGSC